jgi:uncharacterized membrane protein YfcA
MLHEWSFWAAAAPAVILFGISKSGFSGLGALGVPVMALVMPPVEAAAIILPILVVQDWVGVWAFRREVDKRNLAILAPGALIGVALAWGLAARVDENVVRLVVGLVSLAFVVFMIARDRILAGQAARADIAPGLFWGAVSGFTSFISHAGGPPFLVYTMPQKLDSKVFAGTSVLFFAAVNLMKIPPYLLLGQFSRENLTASLYLLPLAVFSTLAGVWVVRRIPADRFYGAVLVVTFGLGVKLVYDAVRALMG